MEPSTCAMIVNVVPEAKRGDSIYTRTVSIRLGAKVIDCFEDKSYVTDEDIGNEVNLILKASQCHVQTISENVSSGINQPLEIKDDVSKWHTSLIGEVVETEEKDVWYRINDNRYLLLDIDVGTVLVEPDEELKNRMSEGAIGAGSMIRLGCGRLNIIGRKDGT